VQLLNAGPVDTLDHIFNWYLYTYLTCAGAMYAASWRFSKVRDEIAGWLTGSRLAAVGGTVLLFVLLVLLGWKVFGAPLHG
jgi:hypothetical protein